MVNHARRTGSAVSRQRAHDSSERRAQRTPRRAAARRAGDPRPRGAMPRNAPRSRRTGRGAPLTSCPSFPSHETAFQAFFYGEFLASSARQVPSGFGTVRVVDDREWFERVRVTPASLEIILGGPKLTGREWSSTARPSEPRSGLQAMLVCRCRFRRGSRQERGCTSRETASGWTTGPSVRPWVRVTWPGRGWRSRFRGP